MLPVFTALEGCFFGVPSHNPLMPEDPGAVMTPELMPLVKSPHKVSDENYYADSAAFYNAALQDRQIKLTLETHNYGPAVFTEYRFTFEPDTDESRSVYAITGGWLYYVHKGQSYPDLLGDAIPDEDMYVLKRFPSSHTVWKQFYPESIPLLTKTVYLNLYPHVNSEANLNDPNLDLQSIPLLTQINKFLSEDFFKKQYKAVTGNPYTGTESWDLAYFHLFLSQPVAIPVAPDAQLGWTMPDPVDPTSSQRLGLSFEINGWSGIEQNVQKFFTYRSRIPGQEGHPLISLITGTPVEAGYIDYIEPREHIGGRNKADLNKVVLTLPAYHALAIDPDNDPPALIVQKAAPASVDPTIRAALLEEQSDHGETKLRLRNPLGLAIGLAFDPGEVEITSGGAALTPDSPFSDLEKIIVFRATATSPASAVVSITTADTKAEILQLQINFLDFRWIPIRFHLLYDASHTLVEAKQRFTETSVREMMKTANYILTRQTNVFLVPVEDELGIDFDELGFTDENLGNVLEWSDSPNSPVGKVNKRIESSQRYSECHVVLAWALWGDQDSALGFVVYDKFSSATPFSTVFLSSVSGSIMVHELLHWFSTQFHGLTLSKFCSGGAELFNHDCNMPDTTWYNNLMAAGVAMDGGKMISLNQALVFNQNIGPIIPQPP